MRFDGRQPNQLRPVTLQRRYLKHVPGSVLVSAGDTRVLVCATVQEGVPTFRMASGGGWFTAEYAMLPASTNIRTTRGGGGREKEIQRLIGRSLRAVIDLMELGPRTVIVDCDVIQADGGTRTASITGAYVALMDCVAALKTSGVLPADARVLKDSVAAVSVGMVNGTPLLDLNYREDSIAEVDLNVVMTGSGRYVEIQGTAEAEPFSAAQLSELLTLAQTGIAQLTTAQRQALASSV